VGGPNSDDWKESLAFCVLCGPKKPKARAVVEHLKRKPVFRGGGLVVWDIFSPPPPRHHHRPWQSHSCFFNDDIFLGLLHSTYPRKAAECKIYGLPWLYWINKLNMEACRGSTIKINIYLVTQHASALSLHLPQAWKGHYDTFPI
jgi:hypothetical protein